LKTNFEYSLYPSVNNLSPNVSSSRRLTLNSFKESPIH
jgi:hypothetical protein